MTGQSSPHTGPFPCGRTRRRFLTDLAGGFGGLALGAMLSRDDVVRASDRKTSPPKSHFEAKAKNVIWLFMAGGVSHMESFDPKPALNKYAGMTVEESPVAQQVLKSPFTSGTLRAGRGS